MCGRYSLAPGESGEISRIVAEVQSQFGIASIHTGEIFPTNAAPVLLAEGKKMTPKPMTWDSQGSKARGSSSTPGVKRLSINRCSAGRCWSGGVWYLPRAFMSGIREKPNISSTCRGGVNSTWPASGIRSRERNGS